MVLPVPVKVLLQNISSKLGYIYIDTGAMYRALTYKIIKNKLDITNVPLIKELAKTPTLPSIIAEAFPVN